MKRLILLFSVSVLLTVQHLEAQTAVTDTVFLQLYNDSVDLKEVVVKGKKTPVANSRWSDMSPVELVTVGGANGDLYQALQTLPGTQVQGESGRLLVRGGSSDETQTYIDGMHVLNPYTATGINSPARGRYSTFMFSGASNCGCACSVCLQAESRRRACPLLAYRDLRHCLHCGCACNLGCRGFLFVLDTVSRSISGCSVCNI